MNSEDVAFTEMKRFLLRKKNSGETFTLRELLDYVFENAGTVHLAPGRDVTDYINDLKERGIISEIYPQEYKYVKKLKIKP